MRTLAKDLHQLKSYALLRDLTGRIIVLYVPFCFFDQELAKPTEIAKEDKNKNKIISFTITKNYSILFILTNDPLK